MITDFLVEAFPVEGGEGWLLEYSTMDQNGHILGARSHFHATTPEGCYQAAIKAHQLAARAVVRLKLKNESLEKEVIQHRRRPTKETGMSEPQEGGKVNELEKRIERIESALILAGLLNPSSVKEDKD